MCAAQRIGFYNPPAIFWNQGNDWRCNPGIGGTEFISNALLHTFVDAHFELSLYSKTTVPTSANEFFLISTVDDAIAHFSCRGGGLFIIVPRKEADIPNRSYHNVKIICWCHCEYSSPMIKIFRRRKEITHVFLTEASRALYAPYKNIWRNCYVIGNFTSFSPEKNIVQRRTHEGLNVFFIGALQGYKHFDYLSRCWPKIVSRIPNAHLHVFGSPSLHGFRGEMGPKGVALKRYEAEIMQPLVKNNCSDSVFFHGNVSGTEIQSALLDADVGVVNPVGTTETFCISAIDFGICGIPIVGGDRGGLKNTIPRGCGFRVRSQRGLTKSILILLKNESQRHKMGQNYKQFVSCHYTYANFQDNWLEWVRTGARPYIPRHRLVSGLSSFFDELRMAIYRYYHYALRRITLRDLNH